MRFVFREINLVKRKTTKMGYQIELKLSDLDDELKDMIISYSAKWGCSSVEAMKRIVKLRQQQAVTFRRPKQKEASK